MDRLDEAKDLGGLVAGLYSAGVQLALSEDGKRVGVVGDVGPGLEVVLRANKVRLLEMLTGDSLHGPGWEGRAALWQQAMTWLDLQISGMGLKGAEAEDRVHQAITAPQEVERLNEAWIDGTFEEFRKILREHVRVGLEAGREGVVTNNSSSTAVKIPQSDKGPGEGVR